MFEGVVLGGVISLVSSVVVLRIQQRATRYGAGRALALEIWGNFNKLEGVADLTDKTQLLPPELLTISRGAFDSQISLVAPLLRLAALQTVTMPYIEAPGTLSLYQGWSDPDNASENIRGSAELFLKAWDVLSPRVFSGKERAELKDSAEGRSMESFRKGRR